MTLGRVLAALFNPAARRGLKGEVSVALGAALRLPSSTYARFHNLTLPVPDGTTQVDHVFVSPFGVFVVETKNMSGWIFGNERDKRWTQSFPGRRRRKYPFQNPLRQNHRHVKAIEAALRPLGVPAGAVRSVVVFVGDAKLKTELPANVTIGMRACARHIKSFTEPVLPEDQVQTVCGVIEARRLPPSWSTDRRHVRGLRSRADPAAARKCPRCGRDMVLRTARQGPNAGGRFWGCAGYPACRAKQEAT